MSKYCFLLGREPLLSTRELESLFGQVEVSGNWAMVDADEERVMQSTRCLGGTIKIGKILESGVTAKNATETLTTLYAAHAVEGKKLRIGLDSYRPGTGKIIFRVKDALKAQGNSIRIVQHDGERVKTATTLHEKLTTQGCELMLIPIDGDTIIAQTLWVQDIDAYTQRDISRERSMRVGMMPPKLAQIMINLGTRGSRTNTLYDPFCGLGTTLIEAAHAGFVSLVGSDIAPPMIEATQTNLASYRVDDLRVFEHDACRLDSVDLPEQTVVVTEGMLGHNFAPGTLTHTQALQERKTLTTLYQNFMRSAYKNTHITTIVCTLPVWHIGRDIVTMPTVEELSRDWRIDALCRDQKRYLSHHRPGQSVSREIIILSR